MSDIYIWFNYTKPSGNCCSKLDWAGKFNIEKAIQIVNKITVEDMLKVQGSNFFKYNVTLNISIQEIGTGKVIFRRQVT